MSVIVIVGGAIGSGGALAQRLARSGNHVVLVDRAAAQLSLCSLADGGLSVLESAPDDPLLPERALAFCHREFGPPDGLFINMHRQTVKPLHHWTSDEFDVEIDFNLTSPFFLARTFALDMARRRRGAILFTSSTAAWRGRGGKAPFHAAKAALSGLCRALADELGPSGVRINCLLPGWIESAFGRGELSDLPPVPLGRFGTTDEVACAAAFLLGQTYVHGSELAIDGGLTATN